MKQTICRCPVCKEIIDVVTHYTDQPHGQSMSMIVSDSRRLHAEQSPQCVGQEGWHRGWDEETIEVTDPEREDVRQARQRAHAKLPIDDDAYVGLAAEETEQVVVGFAPVSMYRLFGLPDDSRKWLLIITPSQQHYLRHVPSGLQFLAWWQLLVGVEPKS